MTPTAVHARLVNIGRPRNLTWWSTAATITACGFRGPTCRQKSVYRPRCNDMVIRINRLSGLAATVEGWAGPKPQKGFQQLREAFHCRAIVNPDARSSLAIPWLADRNAPAIAPRQGGAD